MEETLKANLSHIKYKMKNTVRVGRFYNSLFRTIGCKLNRIEGAMPGLKQHLTELETDYRRVAAFFDDIEAEHEATFSSVRRHLEQAEERKLGELEMSLSRPLAKFQKQSSSPLSFKSSLSRPSYGRAELNPELPLSVSDKYRSGHQLCQTSTGQVISYVRVQCPMYVQLFIYWCSVCSEYLRLSD